MIIDAYGSVKYSVKETLDEMYSGNAVDQFVIDDVKENRLHNEYSKHFEIDNLQQPPTLDVSPEDFHDILSNSWLMPQKYKDMDLNTFLAKDLAEALTIEELEEYTKRNMLDILKFLVYLMNVCRDNSIVTGIGRGSSVSSLVLYLIGVHYIDPVKYNLSYKEFLR